jgi:hypothetical protein
LFTPLGAIQAAFSFVGVRFEMGAQSMRKFTALAAALALAAASIAPTPAAARDPRGGGYDRHYDGGRYDHRYRHYRGHDDHGDAVAAGVIGLVLGLAIGAAASQANAPRGDCTADYQHCTPPPGYGDEYYGKPGYDEGYDPGYDNQGGLYEQDYGPPPPPQPQCTRSERQWDRYANQYVTVDVPC